MYGHNLGLSMIKKLMLISMDAFSFCETQFSGAKEMVPQNPQNKSRCGTPTRNPSSGEEEPGESLEFKV